MRTWARFRRVLSTKLAKLIGFTILSLSSGCDGQEIDGLGEVDWGADSADVVSIYGHDFEYIRAPGYTILVYDLSSNRNLDLFIDDNKGFVLGGYEFSGQCNVNVFTNYYEKINRLYKDTDKKIRRFNVNERPQCNNKTLKYSSVVWKDNEGHEIILGYNKSNISLSYYSSGTDKWFKQIDDNQY